MAQEICLHIYWQKQKRHCHGSAVSFIRNAGRNRIRWRGRAVPAKPVGRRGWRLPPVPPVPSAQAAPQYPFHCSAPCPLRCPLRGRLPWRQHRQRRCPWPWWRGLPQVRGWRWAARLLLAYPPAQAPCSAPDQGQPVPPLRPVPGWRERRLLRPALWLRRQARQELASCRSGP